MKSTFLAVGACALFAFTGCCGGTPGGPGATDRSKTGPADQVNAALNPAPDSFTLTVPALGVKVKQGESKVVSVGISRGKNFDEDVALKFEGLPQGVTAEPAAPAIKHGDTEAKVTLKAAADAAVGSFTVKVVGHPQKGPDATTELKLTVEK
jgi:hypothetical protein